MGILRFLICYVSEPIRQRKTKNTWVFIVVGGVSVIIVAVVAVLFIYKVRPECMCEFLLEESFLHG